MEVRRLSTGIVAGLAVMATVAGCSAEKTGTEKTGTAGGSASSSPTAPSSTDSTVTGTTSAQPSPAAPAPRTEKWTALQVGNCLADAPPTDPAIVTVTLVDCSQPHLAEVFVRAPVPVDAALDGTANAQCESGFLEYTGQMSTGSPYTITYLIDSDQDRTFNNPLPSTVICLLQGAQGQSLSGSAHH